MAEVGRVGVCVWGGSQQPLLLHQQYTLISLPLSFPPSFSLSLVSSLFSVFLSLHLSFSLFETEFQEV